MAKGSPKQPDVNELMQLQGDWNRINVQSPYGQTAFYGPGGAPGQGGDPAAIQQQIDNLKRSSGFFASHGGTNLTGSSPERSQTMAQLRALEEQLRLAQGGAPISTGPTVVQTLSPEQQARLDLQNQLTGLLGNRAISQFGALPGAGAPIFNDDATRERVERASFDRMMGLLNPQFERQEEQLLSRLANQGLPQASRAYTRELGTFGDTRAQANEQAALAAIMAGGQELDRERQAQLQARSTQLNELLSLLGLQQVQMPGMLPPGQVSVPVQQQQGQTLSPLLTGAAGAMSGAAAGAPLGPWGIAGGGLLGGLLGGFAGG